MFFDQDAYWASILSPRGFVAAVAEDYPEEFHALAILCEGRGANAGQSAEFVVADLPEQLLFHGYGSDDPQTTMRKTLGAIDLRMQGRPESAALAVVHVGTAQLVATVVGNVRVFLLAPGRADELLGSLPLAKRVQTLGVHSGHGRLDPDMIVADLTFAHPFLLLATEETLGWLEAAGGSPKDLVLPDDTVESVRDRIARCLDAPESKGAALVVALAVKQPDAPTS